MVESFTDLVNTINAKYPYSVELPMSRGYLSIVDWLKTNSITDYDHYSFLRNNRPYITYSFTHERDASFFALKWN